jgi:Cupin domain/Tetratricopeptide repeat
VRRPLGVSAFGINAYRADAGEQLIEPHDETGSGAGGHEELYVVVSGRATFTVDGEEIDAPPGTLVFVPERESRRQAVALEAGTTAFVVGGKAGAAGPVSPWEFWFATEPARQAGDYARAREILAEGLRVHPGHAVILYELACFHALAGEREQALDYLAQALAGDPKLREHAERDSDLDSIRDEIPGSADARDG